MYQDEKLFIYNFLINSVIVNFTVVAVKLVERYDNLIEENILNR